MRNLTWCLLFITICLSTYSCKKDEILTDPSAKLDFSVDTIMFDTVFTTIGTTTQALIIYNDNSQPLMISSVRLAGGNASPYRLNLDGGCWLRVNSGENKIAVNWIAEHPFPKNSAS